MDAHLTPHPLNTYTSPLRLNNAVGNSLPATYIVCADPFYEPAEESRNWIKEAKWKTVEIAAGHDAMVSAPELLADILLAHAPGRG